MPTFSIIDADGKLLRQGGMPTEELCRAQVLDGEFLILNDLAPNLDDVRVADTWVPRVSAVDAAKAKALARIETERERRIEADIELQGHWWQADRLRSQTNITGKHSAALIKLGRGDELPAEVLIWRTSDDHDIAFPDTAAYANFLGDLIVAISDRGTEAYLWAWQQKALLAAATDFTAIEAIPSKDTTTESKP